MIIRHPANDNRRPIRSRIRSIVFSSLALAVAAGLMLYQLG